MTAFARGSIQLLLTIVAVILITGGGRIAPIDFKSISAWAAPTTAIALLLYFVRGESPYFPRMRAWLEPIARRPYHVLAVIFTVIIAAHLVKMLTFTINIWDAGFLYQPILHPFRGPLLACDICYLDSYLGMHQAFTLPILSPIAALVGSPLIFPVLIGALGWAILLLVGRAYRAELSAYELSFIFFGLLCLRGYREGFFFDLREDLVGAFFFAIALFFVKRKRIYLAAIPFALATLAKETAVFMIPFASLVALYETGMLARWRKREGIAAISLYAVLSAGLFVFVLLISLPAWSPEGGKGAEFAHRLAFLGSEPRAIAHQLIFHPFASAWALAANLWSVDRFKYVLFMIVPFAPFLIGGWNIYYLPGFILILGNLVSLPATQRMMQYHYDFFALPFFAFGLAESIRRMKSRSRLRPGFLAVWILVFLSVSGVWPMTHMRAYFANSSRIRDYFWVRNEASGIKPEIPVLADGLTYPLVVDRANLRYLESKKFDPNAANLAAATKIGDSRVAFLQKSIGDAAFGADWHRIACGPSEYVCRYER